MGFFDSDRERGFQDGVEWEKSDPGIITDTAYGLASMVASILSFGVDIDEYNEGFEEGRESVEDD